MTTNRFNLFDNDEPPILPRASELVIKLTKLGSYTDDEGDIVEGGIIGTFKLVGDIGGLDENAKPEDLQFLRKLLDRFEKVEK